MGDTTTELWVEASVSVTLTLTPGTKDIMEIIKRTRIISTRIHIPREPSRLDMVLKQPRDMHLEMLLHHIEDLKTNLLQGSRFLTSVELGLTTKPHLLGLHQQWEVTSRHTTNNANSNKTNHQATHKPAALLQRQAATRRTIISNQTTTNRRPKAPRHCSSRVNKLLKASIEPSLQELRRRLPSTSIIR